jgi:hypothetical protein
MLKSRIGIFETGVQMASLSAGGKSGKKVDRIQEINQFLQCLGTGAVVETRLIGCHKGHVKPFVVSGYWNEFNRAADELHIADLKYTPLATYVTLNQVNSALLARAPNKLVEYPAHTTTSAEIIRRCNLLVDIDPVRPTGISSTSAERQKAGELAQQIRTTLSENHAWPKPVMFNSSGNGYQLIYAIDLPNDEAATILVKDVLNALDRLFSNDDVKVDKAVGDAARIVKVAGTMTRKGEQVDDRKWRRARIISANPNRVVVTRDQLLSVIISGGQVGDRGAVNGAASPGTSNGPVLDVEAYLHDIRIAFTRREKPDNHGRTVWELKQCPFENDHGGRDTVIFQSPEGKLGVHCFHDRCDGKGWMELKYKLGAPKACHYSSGTQSENSEPKLLNYGSVVKPDGGSIVEGKLITEIADNLLTQTGGWPKRIGSDLFVQTRDLQPQWLDCPAKLMAWIDGQMRVKWKNGADFVSQERFYHHLAGTADAFNSIELCPHWPPVQDVYYMYPELPESDGTYFTELLSEFSPATPQDGELLKAMALTFLWGGKAGSRPGWVISGPTNEPVHGGRGAGKTTVVEVLASLVGGLMMFSSHDPIESINKRLLSSEGGKYRVALLDNVKTLRFSWAELESLITTPVISGHKLYTGECQRQNMLTWAVTLNGGRLSKDLAQRCNFVHLERPDFSRDWQSRVNHFVTQYRWHIVADAMAMLQTRTRSTES